MTFGPQPPPEDQGEGQAQSWLRRLILLALVLLGSFGCMLLAAQIALSGLETSTLDRDVRSKIPADYGVTERRAAPLVPQVIEAVREDERALHPTQVGQVLTVVPVDEISPLTPTAVALITPTPSATATSPPPTDTPAPTDTPIPTLPETDTPQPGDTPSPPTSTNTPTPTDTPTPVSPTPTGTPTPVSPTPTDTPTPTYTPTPTNTPTPVSPTPTDTPTPVSPTPTDTPTPVSPTPTDTPTPVSPTPTETPTSTPLLPPLVSSINPSEIMQGNAGDPDIGVTILGENFVAPTARLGGRISIAVSGHSSTTIAGTLSPDIPAGVYALTVQNSDSQQAVLPRAFSVHPRPNPSSTLNSDVAFISTFGPVAELTEGDHDHVQIIFFEVLDGPDDPLYIQVFDADTGGLHDEPGLDSAFGDTVMAFTVRGGSNAYTDPEARSDRPSPTGIGSGDFITQQVVGVDGLLDGKWLTLPVSRNQGELVGGSRVFKLVLEGTAGDDGNWYQVAISSDRDNNLAVPGARIFAFSWCVALPSPGDEVSLYPFVSVDVDRVTQVNFGFDVSPGASITLSTPVRDLSVSSLSGSGDSASQEFSTFSGERATTWSARYVTGVIPNENNDFSLWFLNNTGAALAIFTAPTLVSPP